LLVHVIYIVFLFALGASIGSFLNVVAWRYPRGESLTFPASRCPTCGHGLAWRDNIPVFGWLALRGKCRYCGNPISSRYPIIEAITGLLFVGYYVAFFILQVGPCAARPEQVMDAMGSFPARPLSINQDWPIYGLYMFLLAALLAASLIDAETFTIPAGLCWWPAAIGILVHTIVDDASVPGAVNASPIPAALALGAGIGLLISIVLQKRGLIPLSFEEGAPLLEIDKAKLREQAREKHVAQGGTNLGYESKVPPDIEAEIPEFTPAQIRAEIRKEILFLLPPLVLGGIAALLVMLVPSIGAWWNSVVAHDWVSGFLGALLGGLVGGFCVWLTRIVFSVVLGREAMGLGDVDLMFAIGAVLGPGGATLAFFAAPFCGMAIAVYRLIFRKGREIPYGPFLSMGAAVVMLFYCPLAAKFGPGLAALATIVRSWFGNGG
jgi:leader peptidase (prepilin peptidase)/N-methyltransferase